MEFCRKVSGSGALIAPITKFFEAFTTGLLKQADTMAGVFKFMDIGPYFSQPMFLMDRRFAASGAAGVKSANHWPGWRLVSCGQLDEDTAYFLDVLIGVNHMLVAQQKAKSELARFRFGLGTGLKGSVFGPQLLDGITRHPETFFSGHRS